jgi:hypothetical protein
MWKMKPQLSPFSLSRRSLHNTLSSVRWRKKLRPHEHLTEVGEDGRLKDGVGHKVLMLEAELLQQQQEERPDRQHQPTGEVGDEEHELPGGKTIEERSASADPSSVRRRPPSEQVAH